MAARFARRIHRNPIRVRRLHVVVGRVRIGAADDDHTQPAAAGNEFAEEVAIAKPRATVVERELGRVIRHAAARAEADRVGVSASEVIEPELEVELAWVIIDERELCPAHRSVHPTRRGGEPRGSLSRVDSRPGHFPEHDGSTGDTGTLQ